jgi:hypothetical protein
LSRKPNIDPNIYQVDLVAGLFGAFMMVWISGAQNSEFPGEAVTPPTYAVLKLQVVATPSGAFGGRYSATDMLAADQQCLSGKTLQQMGAKLPTLDCPEGTAEHLSLGNVAIFAFYRVATCQGSSAGAVIHPYSFGYSLQYGLNVPKAWKLRGYALTPDSHQGTLPGLETGWDIKTKKPDTNKALSSSITEENTSRAAAGQQILICDPKSQPWSQVAVYFIPEDFDIWRKPDLEMDLDPEPSSLNVFGNVGPGTALKQFILDDWLKIKVNWPQRTMDAELCAYRDDKKLCFTSHGTPLPSSKLKLARV